MRITKPMLLLLAAASLAACENTAGTVSDNRNAIIGTGLGAAAGSIAGRIVSPDKDADRYQKAGMLVGAIGGAVLGSQLDAQERALRDQMAGSGAVIQNTGQSLNVILPEAITFATDSAIVRTDFVAQLGQLAANLRQFPNSTISIVGHTDDTGSAAYNQRLSEQRAQAVANVLINQGVSPARITTRGDGEFSPVASNATAAGRQQNRRVVVTITPTQ